MANEKVWTPEQREAAYALLTPHDTMTDLRCELSEAVELLKLAIDSDESLGFVVACNTQDPDMHEEECPKGYVNECGRCEYVHQIQEFLKRNEAL